MRTSFNRSSFAASSSAILMASAFMLTTGCPKPMPEMDAGRDAGTPTEDSGMRDAGPGDASQGDTGPLDAGCTCGGALCISVDGVCTEVECLTDDHCAASPSGPLCIDNSCGCADTSGMTGDQVCEGHPSAAGALCHEGACVECTAADSSACVASGGGPTPTCNLLRNTCDGLPVNAVRTCGECTNDAQCRAIVDPISGRTHPMRCVSFPSNRTDGTPEGYHCIMLYEDPAAGGAGCLQPFFRITGSDFVSLSSLPGDGANHEFCGFNRDRTSCQAIHATIGPTLCTPDAEGRDVENCGAAGLCRNVPGGSVACTYECSLARECPNSSTFRTCGVDGAGGPLPTYCGGTPL